MLLHIVVCLLLRRQLGCVYKGSIGETLLEYVVVWSKFFEHSQILKYLYVLPRNTTLKLDHNSCYLSSHMCIDNLFLWHLAGALHLSLCDI